MTEQERLRQLIKLVEARGCNCGAHTELSGCPWCGGEPHRDQDGSVPDTSRIRHFANCLAFTQDGAIR